MSAAKQKGMTTDLETGYVVGCKTVLVRTGYGPTSEEQFVDRPFQPDYVADNVLEASRWILKQTVAGNHAGQVWHDFGEV